MESKAKLKPTFRSYENAKDVVKDHYRKQRTNQTVKYTSRMLKKYCTKS